jgi:hypothetical protein
VLIISDTGACPNAEATASSLNLLTMAAGIPDILHFTVTSAKVDSKVVLAIIVIAIGE